MLAECRHGAGLLGDRDGDLALDLVLDRERRFFFFSWGLLEGEGVQTGETMKAGGEDPSIASAIPAVLTRMLSLHSILILPTR